VASLRRFSVEITQVGLEAGTLTQYLTYGLRKAGYEVVYLEARQTAATLAAMRNKIDRNDARGLAQILRSGWYRTVHVKSLESHQVRALLVLSVGFGVQVFTLDRDTGSFLLTQENVRIPSETKEFAINMSNMRHWEPPVKRYVHELLAGSTGPRGKDFNMRWVASMVADVHRIMSRGGIFMYPRDARDPNRPGRLRLMYEGNPMSFLVEQADGAATDGHRRILEVEPTGLHQRVAVFLGSRSEVERVTCYHRA
jgi:hypothetical protein